MARSHTVTSLTRRTPTRRKVPRHVREQQMLAVAERAFAAKGFHRASVDAIAEGVGVTKPMVYAYFGSKEGLYRACMVRARERLFDTLRENVDVAAPPDDQLWHGVLAFFTFVQEQHDSWAVLLGEVTAGTGPFAAEGAEIRRELARLVGDLLRRAAEEEGIDAATMGLADQLARALIGAGESLAVWWEEHPEEPAERVALVLMNFAWNGLGGLVAGRTWTPRAA
jgi:AcrR family transcriptional regulator